jgi:hypothetical protein
MLEANNGSTFDNGLSAEHNDAIDDLMVDLKRIGQKIEGLGRHRSYALAQTKIEETVHWLRDRKHKPEDTARPTAKW